MNSKKHTPTANARVLDSKKSGVARSRRPQNRQWSLVVQNDKYVWTSKMDRVGLIRKGLPYGSFEVISTRANLPINKVLRLFGMPQTTYNKKKNANDLLTGRDTEVVLMLTELLDFGIAVFNDEKEKFQRWLKKENISLGGVSPESLFDSITGIQEVRNSLNRIEYGNMA